MFLRNPGTPSAPSLSSFEITTEERIKKFPYGFQYFRYEIYKVGDKVQVFSMSKNSWQDAFVKGFENGRVLVKSKGFLQKQPCISSSFLERTSFDMGIV